MRASGCSWAPRKNPHETGSEKGNVPRREIGVGRKSSNFRRELAPRAGLEPATLRLTGGKEALAARCGGLLRVAGFGVGSRRLRRLATFALCRLLPLIAALCCIQRAKERATSNRRVSTILGRDPGHCPSIQLRDITGSAPSCTMACYGPGTIGGADGQAVPEARHITTWNGVIEYVSRLIPS